MKDLMNAKPFLKNNMPWCAAYNFTNSSKNIPEKIIFALPKSECNRTSKLPALNRKEGNLVENQQASVESILRRALFVTVLLCTAKNIEGPKTDGNTGSD